MTITLGTVRVVALAVIAAAATACTYNDNPLPTAPSAPATPGRGADVTLFGKVENVSGSCPALTITFNGTVVKTGDATGFTGQLGCPGVKAGDTGVISGFRQDDGSVLGNVVSLTSSSTFPVVLSGTVTRLSGTCPDLVMTIGVIDVHTNGATNFNAKPCAEIKVGDTANIAGTRTEAVVTATRVDASTTPPPPPTVSVVGTVEEVTGTCPALTMKIGSTTIVTNASTAFGGTAACSGIRAGSGGLVSGTRQADGTVLATFVSLALPK